MNEPTTERPKTRTVRQRSKRELAPTAEASARRPRGEPFSTLYEYLGPESDPDEDPIEPFSDSEYNGL